MWRVRVNDAELPSIERENLKTETRITYIADDGTRFNNEVACLKHEEKIAAFRELVNEKIGDYQDAELLLGGHAQMDSLPFEAPWMSPLGACLINVTGLRRSGGVVEFQLGDSSGVPYENGNAWCKAGDFYSEWPD